MRRRLVVNRRGQRFGNEYSFRCSGRSRMPSRLWENCFVNIPRYLIFDHRPGGDLVVWRPLPVIRRGLAWVLQGQTLAELAQQLGCQPQGLKPPWRASIRSEAWEERISTALRRASVRSRNRPFMGSTLRPTGLCRHYRSGDQYPAQILSPGDPPTHRGIVRLRADRCRQLGPRRGVSGRLPVDACARARFPGCRTRCQQPGVIHMTAEEFQRVTRLPRDHGAHGDFDARATRSSLQFSAQYTSPLAHLSRLAWLKPCMHCAAAMAVGDRSGVDDCAAAAAWDVADATDCYLALICVQSSSYRRDFFPRSCTNCSLVMISGGR